MLTFGELFAGIGGISLGFERAGMIPKWHVELDDYATIILEKHWLHVTRYRDIRDCGRHNLEPVDVIAGGTPCQDVSLAGKRLGLEGERSTLWGEFARIVGELRPRWVVAENVLGLLSANSGRFFGNILRDLAALGYDATWNVLRASDFGAPHRRERVILVAHPDGERIERLWQAPIPRFSEFSWCQDVRGPADLRGRSDIPEPLVYRKGDGFSARMDRLGNAVVPQLAEYIGRLIVEAS